MWWQSLAFIPLLLILGYAGIGRDMAQQELELVHARGDHKFKGVGKGRFAFWLVPFAMFVLLYYLVRPAVGPELVLSWTSELLGVHYDLVLGLFLLWVFRFSPDAFRGLCAGAISVALSWMTGDDEDETEDDGGATADAVSLRRIASGGRV